MVFIRKFPEVLPRVVLQDTLNELLLFVPEAERKAVRTRVAPADSQFTMIFPTAAKADSFIERFRAEDFYYEDPDSKLQTILLAVNGKPLAVRRRGTAVYPVYAKVEELLHAKEYYRGATIVQNKLPRSGVWTTEFVAQVGRSPRRPSHQHDRED